MASTTLQAQYIPSFAATWNITLTSPNSTTATLLVAQSPANADGQFPATGTLTFASGNSGTISLTGLVSGASLQLADPNSSLTLTANNAALPVTVSIGGSAGGTGTMTR